MKLGTLKRLQELKAAKIPVVIATEVLSGEQELIICEAGREPRSAMGDAVVQAAVEALSFDRSRMLEIGGREYFLHAVNPPLRMAVVGAVHITQSLAPMATMVGYEVTVFDPRRAFASVDRFKGVALSTEWPDDGLAELAPDSRTAIVTLTHDPKIDDPALQAALRSPAFYIGSLGSRRTHASRVERLREAGFSPEEIKRIKGPIGLDIGARSPSEIAISILGEVTAELRLGVRP